MRRLRSELMELQANLEKNMSRRQRTKAIRTFYLFVVFAFFVLYMIFRMVF